MTSNYKWKMNPTILIPHAIIKKLVKNWQASIVATFQQINRKFSSKPTNSTDTGEENGSSQNLNPPTPAVPLVVLRPLPSAASRASSSSLSVVWARPIWITWFWPSLVALHSKARLVPVTVWEHSRNRKEVSYKLSPPQRCGVCIYTQTSSLMAQFKTATRLARAHPGWAVCINFIVLLYGAVSVSPGLSWHEMHYA